MLGNPGALPQRAAQHKGISIILYASDLGFPAVQKQSHGSDLINDFIKILDKKISEKVFSWDIFTQFSKKRIEFITSLNEIDFPKVSIFKPTNIPEEETS